MNEFTKTIVNGLKSYVQNNIKKARSNWNQNDETAVDYVKNRTHWTETKFVDVIPETTLYSSSGRTRDAAGPSLTMFYVTSEHISKIPNFTVGEEYIVIWNGTEYKCKARVVSEVACLGNEFIAGGIKNTGEPFFIMPDTFDFYREESSDDVLCMVGTTESLTEVTIKVSGLVTTVHKIDAKYLPEIKNIKNLVDGKAEGSIRTIGTNTEIGEYAFAEGTSTKASGINSHAEGSNTTASGDSSHAEGINTKASGNGSHTEGAGTTASYFYSHAEGNGTKASGNGSHAEGYNTTASGGYGSHAEGYKTNATNQSSHAEGHLTTASGEYSHAEGDITTASGLSSHAEGVYTIASGAESHAEGHGTIALSTYQHVQGKYNVEDNANKYAHIVGNGEYSNDGSLNSNAHTLDWEGNAWFAGDIRVGGTGQDDNNSVSVITEKNISSPRNYFSLIDLDNGYTYIVQMKNGNLVTRCSVSNIEVTTMPDKVEYYVGEYINTAGMVVIGTCQDGNSIELTDYTCTKPSVIGENTITISYVEAGKTYTTTITVNAVEFDAATILIDFDYTTNDDGTYTITGWKQTLNGVPSTEMIIPDYSLIRL